MKKWMLDTWRKIFVSAAIVMTAPAIAQQVPDRDLSLPPAWNASAWQPPADQFDVDVEEVTVRMDDGVVLRADVMYPLERDSRNRASGSFPVLLEQTPYRWPFYPDEESVVQRGRYFVSRGYIYVLAHTRGTADSGGDYDFFGPRESQDGVELVDWASRLSGGNGDVGLVGCSATGINQFLTAGRLGPDSPVRAIAAGGMGESAYSEVIFPGGMYSSGGDWVYATVFSQLGTPSSIQASLSLLANLRSGGSDAILNEFWEGMAPGNTVEDVVRNRIPVLLYSGWLDVYPSPPYLMTMLQNAAAERPIYGQFEGPASPLYQVIMAPGPHCSGDNGGARDQANLRWFETWMRDQPTGIASLRSPFHFHSLNSDEWKSFNSMPLGDEYKLFHFTSDAQLSEENTSSSTKHDTVLYYGDKTGGSNSASFTSAPLQTPHYIVGGSSLTLTLMTADSDALVVADLYDVSLDGTETRITRGNLLGSRRAPLSEREWRRSDGELIRPGYDMSEISPVLSEVPFSLSVELQPRFALIETGHRLRLTLKPRSDATTGDCDPRLEGPYPCLIGTLPQQIDLLNSSYEIASNGTLALPLIEAAGLSDHSIDASLPQATCRN